MVPEEPVMAMISLSDVLMRYVYGKLDANSAGAIRMFCQGDSI